MFRAYIIAPGVIPEQTGVLRRIQFLDIGKFKVVVYMSYLGPIKFPPAPAAFIGIGALGVPNPIRGIGPCPGGTLEHTTSEKQPINIPEFIFHNRTNLIGQKA